LESIALPWSVERAGAREPSCQNIAIEKPYTAIANPWPKTAMPTGPFTYEFTVQRSGRPAFVQQEKDGVTYLVQGRRAWMNRAYPHQGILSGHKKRIHAHQHPDQHDAPEHTGWIVHNAVLLPE
jgi:hypothetical protein